MAVPPSLSLSLSYAPRHVNAAEWVVIFVCVCVHVWVGACPL